MIKVKCPHCPKVMNIGDEYAGKKIRCPACKEVIAVPAVAAAVQPAPAPKAPAPVQKAIQPPKRPPVKQDDEELAEVMSEDDTDEDYNRKPRKRSKRRSLVRGAYADCPNCGAGGDAKRVGFTWWGGALGPWILCHVRCKECGTCYNGRTGKDNTVGIIIYTAVGAGIGLMLGAVAMIVAFMK
jgi:hypothetical protein